MSLSGAWVPETSWSFHYWQPAPRWRLHRWLAKHDNPAMSPHASEKTSTCGKAEGEGRRKQKPRKTPHIILLPATLINKYYGPKQVPNSTHAQVYQNH